jgi:hypothetical protein
MTTKNLACEAVLKLSVGHLLSTWDILANKLSGTPFLEALDESEKRAVWALQDLCEHVLVENGISSLPAPEWEKLVQEAKEHVRSIPVECLD